MALSMEEQKLLSEIASRLTEDDPRLAERLAAFGRRRRGRRVRLIAAIVIVVVAAATGGAAAIAVLLS